MTESLAVSFIKPAAWLKRTSRKSASASNQSFIVRGMDVDRTSNAPFAKVKAALHAALQTLARTNLRCCSRAAGVAGSAGDPGALALDLFGHGAAQRDGLA